MSEHGSRPFAAGSFFGVRSFAIRDGWLVGPSFNQRYRPGENHAVCYVTDSLMGAYVRSLLHDRVSKGMDFDIDTLIPPGTPQRRTIDNHVARVNCSCGFYSYWDNEASSYAGGNAVNGIIEGYGNCTYGHRGFKCSKLKIAALITPPGLVEAEREEWLNTNEWLQLFCLTPILTAVTIALLIHKGWLIALIPTVAVVAVVGFTFLGRSMRLDRAREIARHLRRNVSTDEWRAIRKHYPEVPVFDTMKEAQKVFPIINPDTGKQVPADKWSATNGY